MSYWSYTAREIRKPSKVSSLGYKVADIPWAEGAEIYDTAANSAIELTTKAFRAKEDLDYANYIKHKEEEWELVHYEEGAYEGDMRAEFPQHRSPIPNIKSIGRRAGQAAFTNDFLVARGIAPRIIGLLPELISLIGSWHVTRNEAGKISALQFCKDHFNTPERMGMHRLLTLNAKSSILPKQYSGAGKEFCALVPLIPYAIRKAKELKYSEWDRSEIHYVTHTLLTEAMLWEPDPEFEVPSNEQLLHDRMEALMVKSGPKVGTYRNPVSAYKLWGTNGTCYEKMPEYVAIMYSQIWCAHPDNRTKYMVLDPLNWDNVPVALVDPNAIKASFTPWETNSTDSTDTPW